jgi:hypothetical protein
MSDLIFYRDLLGDIKRCIRQAQNKAFLSINAEMITMYWDIGRIIFQRQKTEGWGAGVIPRLSRDLHNELPEQKGFSERNIKFMVQLYIADNMEDFSAAQLTNILPVESKKGNGFTWASHHRSARPVSNQ